MWSRDTLYISLKSISITCIKGKYLTYLPTQISYLGTVMTKIARFTFAQANSRKTLVKPLEEGLQW